MHTADFDLDDNHWGTGNADPLAPVVDKANDQPQAEANPPANESVQSKLEEVPAPAASAAADIGSWADEPADPGCGQGQDIQGSEVPSGRPDLGQESQRSGRTEKARQDDQGRKSNWRELHGVAADNPELADKIVDNLLQSMQTVEVKLADKQADINSPLYSAKSFEQLGLYATGVAAQSNRR